MLLYGNTRLLLFEKTIDPRIRDFYLQERNRRNCRGLTKRKRQKVTGGYNPLLNLKVELFS
jgi:hypothetical protein